MFLQPFWGQKWIYEIYLKVCKGEIGVDNQEKNEEWKKSQFRRSPYDVVPQRQCKKQKTGSKERGIETKAWWAPSWGKLSWGTLKRNRRNKVKTQKGQYVMERITRRFPYYIKLSMDQEICCANSSEPVALHEIRASPDDFVILSFPILNTDQITVSRCI